MPFSIAGGKAQLTAKVPMLDLAPGPLGLAVDGCKVKLTTKSDHAGDITVAFTLDPAANAFTGEPEYGQSFQRGEVKRLGDCDLELHLEIQDFDFTAKLTLERPGHRDAGRGLGACSS